MLDTKGSSPMQTPPALRPYAVKLRIRALVRRALVRRAWGSHLSGDCPARPVQRLCCICWGTTQRNTGAV